MTSALNKANNTTSGKQEALIRRIQKRMGGQARLKSISDPHVVRKIALEALAADQVCDSDAARILQDNLTNIERKCVRTVTNRVTSVRSRQRQRDQLKILKQELVEKDAQLSVALANVQKVLLGISAPDLTCPVSQPIQAAVQSLPLPADPSLLPIPDVDIFEHIDIKQDPCGLENLPVPSRMLSRAEEEALLHSLACFHDKDQDDVLNLDNFENGDTHSCCSD
jgi:hypothetical protein